MVAARLVLDTDFTIAELDRRVFGSFVEHLGRCVYGGIFEPGHASADASGLRGDVLALVRELGVTLVRYPGGNFVSGYRWEDGVGPVAQRPPQLDLAWGSLESNRFGLHEFMHWCKAAGVEPMLAVNLGTRGADDARRLLEYCNHPGGTELSELRRANGSEAPFGVRHWCLGNEVDGPWQIGQKSADEYGQLARETAKLMRWVDPTLALTACGSSNRSLRSYGRWEDRVLEHCHDDVDFISVHAYFENPHADTAEFLGNIELLDRHVREVAAIADAVGARRHSPRQVMVAVDEWNIWYRARSGSQLRQPGWPEAPALLEEVYTFEDALAAGGALCVLMNNAYRVKIACQAQLVNAIGAIMTRTGGPAWRQTIFHPFALASRHARGRVLRTAIDCGAASSRAGFDMPYLVASATHDAASGHIALFVLNRHLREPMDLHVSLRGIPGEASVTSAWELHHPDLTAANSESDPQQVEPRTLQGIRLQDGRLTARLQPASWNVIVLAHAGTQPAP